MPEDPAQTELSTPDSRDGGPADHGARETRSNHG
jgi:hypothetical protein